MRTPIKNGMRRKKTVNPICKLTPTKGNITKTNKDKTTKETTIPRIELSIIRDRYAPPLISI